jgi:tRNA (cmo5U34)-methyltransferase
MDEWNSAAFAKHWDAEAEAINPTRVEQLDVLLAVAQDSYRDGTVIVALGAGSGLVEERLLERMPSASVVAVDGSPAMLALARERLEERVELVEHDLEAIDSLQVPAGGCSVVLAVQALHNVSHEAKRRAFAWMCRALIPGGLALVLDRIIVPHEELYGAYLPVWRRLGYSFEDDLALTYESYERELAAKGDMPATLDDHLKWLEQAGMSAVCLHLHGDRALIAARRPRPRRE